MDPQPIPREQEEPTQKTPKGYEIPVPKKDDVMRVLKKAAQPLSENDSKK